MVSFHANMPFLGRPATMSWKRGTIEKCRKSNGRRMEEVPVSVQCMTLIDTQNR